MKTTPASPSSTTRKCSAKRFRKPMAFLMMALTGLWQVAPTLHAATLTWDTTAGDGGTITGGSGTWTNGLGNWNTGSGDTTWNNTTPDAAIFGGTAGTVTLGGAVTVGNMVFNSGYTIAGGGNALTLSNSTITANAAATISAALSGSTGLSKDGTGTLTLSGTNSYTGVTTITAGVLSVTSLANGGISSGIGAATNVASNLVLNGGTLQYNSTTTANTDRLFSVGTAGGTISMPVAGTLNLTNTGNIGFNGQTGTRTLTFAFSDSPSNVGTIVFSSGITDNGGATSLVKANTFGILRLTSNNNTYTGTTTINGGSISIGVVGGSTGSIGSGNIIINNGGTLVSSRSGAVNLSQTISGGGGVTLNGNTQLTLSGTNTYTGVTTILGNGGVVIVSDIENGGVASSIGASSSAAGNLSITNLSTLRYTGAGATTDRLFSVPTGTPNPVGTIEASGSGALVFTNAGAVGFGGSTGARTLVLSGTNTQDNTMTPVIGDNSGATALTKSGTGTWVVAGANSYTGVTTVSGGVMSVSSLANGGSNSNIGASTNAATNVVLNGGTLQYRGAAVSTDRLFSVGTSGGTLDASGTGAVNFTNTGSMGFNSQTGTRTLTLTGTNTGANTMAAVIGDNSGATALTKSGAGTWVLTGANTYSGVTTVSGGVLQIGNGGTSGALGGGSVTDNASLAFNRSDAVTVSNVISGTGSVVQAGAGTTTLSGANSYSGATVINAGVLNVTSLANGGSSSNIGASSSAASNLVLNGGTLKYSPGAGSAVSTDRLFSVGTSGGTIDASGGFNINFTNTGAMGFNDQSGTRTLTLTGNNANNNTLAVVIGDNGGATSVTKAGGGIWVLSGANTYTGATTMTGTGVLKASTLANGGVASSIGASSNDASNLVLNGGTFMYTGGTVSTDRLFSVGTSGATLNVFGSGAITFTNTGSMGFNGQSGARTLTLANASGGTSTIAAVIGDNGGPTSVTKINAGIWALTGANTYTGVTTIGGPAGVTFLAVTNLADGGVASNIGASSNAATNLVLNGGTLQYTGAGSTTDRLFSLGTNGISLDASGTGDLNFTNTGAMGFNGQSGTRTLSLIGNWTGSNTIAAVIGDNGGATSVSKLGVGKWVLSGNNTYSGVTTISGGVLQVGNGGTAGSLGSGTVTNNASLVVNRSDAFTLANTISGTGSLTQSGTGTTTLTGTNSYGNTTISAGTLQVGNGGTSGTLGSGTITNNGTLIVDRSNAVTISGVISGTGAFIQNGAGTTTLSGNGNAWGSATVNGGILAAGSASGLGSLSPMTVNSGGTLATNGFVLGATVGSLSGSGTVQNGGATNSGLFVNGIASSTFSGVIQNGGTGTLFLTKMGVLTTLTLSGSSSTYTGVTTISGGTLSLSTLANGGSASSMGASSSAAANLIINNSLAVLQYTGAEVSTDRLFSIGSSSGTVDASGTGAVNFTNTGSMGFNGQTGARMLTLTGTNTGNNTLAAVIGDNGGATALTKSGAGTWVIAGNNSYSGTTSITAGTLQVGNGGTTGKLGSGTVNNAAALVINRSDAVTIANAISGTGTFTQAGTGATTFSSGTKSYTGATFVNGGKLQAGGTNAFSTGSAITIASGAILEINGFNVVIGGLSGSGTIQNGTATGATLNIGGSASTSFDGLIQNGGSGFIAINKGGSGGTLTLTGSNTYTGGTVVSAGTLSVSALANGGVASNIGASSNAASSLILTGGTLRYTGAAVSTDRLFSVTTSGGTLDASGTGAVNFTNTGSMGFNFQSGARTLTLSGTNTGANTIAAVIGDNGGATTLVKSGAGTWVLTGANTYTGTTTINAGVLQVGNGNTSGSLGSGAVINNAQLTVNRSDAVTIGNAISGNGAFTQAGTGTTTLTGSNSYTGVTKITSGVLNVTSLANGGSSSGIGASSNAASNLVINGGTLQYTGSSNVSTDRLFSVGIGSAVIDVSGSGTVNFTNTGSMGFNGESGARTLTLTGTNTSGPNIIAAAIGDFGGATSVVIDGAATWVLTGANTYTGATTLSAGVLQIGGSSLASAIIVGANAILEIDGLNTSIGSLAGSGTVRNNAVTAATLTVGGNDLSTTFSGVIKDGGAGALSLVKTGTGTFTLTGANTYGGTTTISSGELQVGSGGTTGTLGSGAVTNNAQLTINRSNAITLANVIGGSGSLTQAGAGTTTLTGSNSYSGSTTISGGVLSVAVLANGGASSNIGASSNAASNLLLNGGTLQYTGEDVSTDRLFSMGTNGGTLDASGTGTVNFANTGSMGFNGQSGIRTLTLTGANGGGNTLAAVIGDNGGATSLTKAGTGTWVLTGANTYTGNTTVNAGTLQIGDGGTTGSLSTSSSLDIGGTLAFNRSDTVTQGTDFANVISGSGGVTQAGSGTLSLTGINTYGGATNVSSGILEVTSDNALGTNAAGTQVSSGGTLLLNNVNYSTAEDLTLNGSGAGNGGALRNSGTSTYTGQITAATDASINAGGGILNLTGGLVKDGTVLTITGGGTVYVSGTGISGGSANSDLVVDGTNLVVSADSDYNGPTTVKNGAVLVANAAVATTQFDLSSDSTLAGTGGITTAMNQSIFINGAMSVGDPAIIPTATSFALTTSGTGAVVLGASSLIHLDLFTGAGAGNNLANASAADSINLHGKIDATAGGTLVIGNPNGMTGFRGGDQWQLFNLNSGSANAGSFISNLALNDSSLSLASGVTSYLDQSTGVFSIIDTNGGLATAAAEGQALIGAGNTVTADLNGHLFNLRAGGGEEEDAGSGSIAAALYEEVIVGEGDGDSEKKESPIVKSVPRSRQWEVFATVNYGNVKLSPIRTQSGVQVDSWASGAGIERHFTRGLRLGFAVSFLQSTQGFSGNLGSLYMEGPALSSYVSYVRGAFWNSLLYSFGTYQMDTVRNPGAPFPTANGSTRAYTHSVQYNTGWNFRFQNKTLVTGPFAGVDYLHGTVDAYSETGGGLAALHYGAQSFQSLVSRVGWSASKKFETRYGMITPQVRLSYERQNIKNNNGTNVSLINVPFSSFAGNQNPGQDYLVAGMGVSIAFSERFSLMLSYQGQFFRHDLQAHFGSVRFSYQF